MLEKNFSTFSHFSLDFLFADCATCFALLYYESPSNQKKRQNFFVHNYFTIIASNAVAFFQIDLLYIYMEPQAPQGGRFSAALLIL